MGGGERIRTISSKVPIFMEDLALEGKLLIVYLFDMIPSIHVGLSGFIEGIFKIYFNTCSSTSKQRRIWFIFVNI